MNLAERLQVVHTRFWGMRNDENLNSTHIQPGLPPFTTTNIGVPVFSDEGTTMLIRSEYEYIWDQIRDVLTMNASRDVTLQHGGMVVTGHSGIGKSYFLLYALIQRLLDRNTVAISWQERPIFYFDEDGVHVVDPLTDLFWTPPLDTWLLSDSSSLMGEPCTLFRALPTSNFLIQTTSPKTSCWKSWVKDRFAVIRVMDPWSKAELQAINRFVLRIPVNEGRLLRMCAKFGPSARVCFQTALSPELEKQEENDVRRAAQSVEDIESVVCGIHSDRFGEKLTDKIFMPVRQPGGATTVEFVSKFAAEAFFDCARNRETVAVQQLYKYLIAQPQTRDSAGWLHEALAHELLTSGTSFNLLSLGTSPIHQP